jgi:aspartyl-tRNA(Asn)/glutamyl-tRNA(Gln) amidotransferase subunit C
MISKEEVLHLAELARLKLADVEVESLGNDISNILNYVSQVAAVSTRNGGERTPTTPVLHNVMREDTPRGEGHAMTGKEEAIKSAFPKREGEFNVVRKIIQKDE